MGDARNESDEPLSELEGFLRWVGVVVTGLFAYGVAYLPAAAAFGETPGHITGITALIVAAVAWIRWGPELPDIPD